MIYHITTKESWEAASERGEYRGDTLAGQGFIHCSTAAQLAQTAKKYFSRQTGLIVLEIDEARLASPLRYEESPDGGVFPHLYGPLNMEAVARVVVLEEYLTTESTE